MTTPGETSSVPIPELNPDILNDITRSALVRGALFGRGVDLTEQNRAQLLLVADRAGALLESQYEDPQWKRFEQLIDEGRRKGALTSFGFQPDTNVPPWCIDGGPDAPVRKALTEAGTAAIEVPSSVFNLYHWTLTIRSLRSYATTSSETLFGRSAKGMGRDLYQLSHLLRWSSSDEEGQASH